MLFRSFILWPLIGVAGLTAVVAGFAAAFGTHSVEMLVIASVAGGATLVMASCLAGFLARERRAAGTALQNVEARVSSILDSAMDAVITVDEEQHVVIFNTAAERVFRWPRRAVIGQPLEMLIPARYREAHRAHVERFGATGVTSRTMGAQQVLRGLRADGEEFPLEASISQLVEDGRRYYTVILRDVTERVRAEQLHARDEARLRGIQIGRAHV